MPVLFSLTVTIGGACPYEVDPVFLRPAGWHISHLRRRGIRTDSEDEDGGGNDDDNDDGGGDDGDGQGAMLPRSSALHHGIGDTAQDNTGPDHITLLKFRNIAISYKYHIATPYLSAIPCCTTKPFLQHIIIRNHFHTL